MDDFGAGHSSLMYLKEYKFSKVKLDGSLVREILTDPNCREIVKSIIALGRELSYSVIAEFVESPEQRDMLYSSDASVFRGTCSAPPCPSPGCTTISMRTDRREMPTLCLSALRLSETMHRTYP